MGRLARAVALVLASAAAAWACDDAPSVPSAPAGPRDAGPVTLELPATGAEARVLHRASGVGLAFAPRLADGNASVSYRVVADGVEDFVTVRDPGVREVRYDVGLERVAGLRLIDGVLELLDAGGAPRLRVTASHVEDAAGRRVPVRLELGAECARDEDPRAPWGRPVVPPGRDHCELRASWDPIGLAYPVVLDPSWTATGNMVVARYRPIMERLVDGRVLVAGGASVSVVTATAELYDPASGTWASTGSMAVARRYHRASRLNDGRVLVTGNFLSSTNTAELYDPAAGTWASTGPLVAGRNSHTQTTLPSGKVLVAGGGTSAWELWNPATGQFTSPGNLVAQRYYAVATLLSGGKVLLAGGYMPAANQKTCELFDSATETWSLTGSLVSEREYAYGVGMTDGRVLLAGGYGPIPSGSSYEYLNTAEIYDPVSATWSATANMAYVRDELSLTSLPGGAVLAYGGYDGYDGFNYTELFDPKAGKWTTLPAAPMARFGHAATALLDGRVLVAGGADTGVALKTAHLFALDANGQSCSLAIHCSSGYCVDGVCCDSACTGACQACTAAKKSGGQDGSCGPVASGTDPDDDCPPLAASTCGATGVCNGAGACALHPSGTACGSPSCQSGTLETSACNGSGACIKSQASCAPYVCAGATSCYGSCNDSGQCAAGAYCDLSTHQCKSSAANGTSCQTGSECATGFCVDGVCCDSACNAVCQSCVAATNGGADGTCGFATAGSDPHDSCPDDGASSCKKDGACDGAGACRVYPSGTACGATQCVKNAQVGYACNGTGACLAGANVACAPFACSSGACKASCASDDDCDAASYCASQTCVARKDSGTSCSAKGECLSNLCVDGVCCNAPCGGQCESCAQPGAPGTCLPVEGEPVGGRAACPAGASACEQKKCNGVDRDVCAAFVGAEVVCQAASCADGVEQTETTCDGAGSCPAPEPKPCSPYVCGVESCKTTCSGDSDCATGAHCDASTGKCVSTGTCSDDRTLVIAGQAPIDCAPYRCANGTCGASCQSAADCIAGHVCGASSTCVPAGTSSAAADDSGCGCRVQGRGAPSGAWLLAFVALALARRRRRDARA